MNTMRIKTLTAASSAAVLLALAGCGDREEVQTGGQPVDQAGQQTAQTMNETRQETEQTLAQAREESQQAIQEARQESQEAIQEAREQSREALDQAQQQSREAYDSAREGAQQQLQQANEQTSETLQEARQEAREAREEARDVLAEQQAQAERAQQEASDARQVAERASEQVQQQPQQSETASLYGPREGTTREDHRAESTATLGAGAAAAGDKADDAQITSRVNAQLAQEERLSAMKIDVDTEQGVVTLKGKVGSDAAKERAAELARDVDGVQNVRNELEVDQQQASASQDGQQQTAMLTQPQADRDTDAGKAQRDQTASMGAGSGDASKDAQITSKVNSAMTREERLRAANVEVEAKDGVVTLKGKVASEQAKERAAELARGVEGVQSVRNELQVDQQAAGGSQERTGAMGAGAASGAQASGEQDKSRGIGTAVNDATITAKVNTGLSVDKRLSAMDIDVDTRNGVVTLKGKAPTEEAKRHAEEIARNVQDVRSVQNQLQVEGQAAAASQPSQPNDAATMGAGGSDKR